MAEEHLYAGMSYEKVVEKFSDTVLRICAVRCGNLEDAKDCFQNVFLKLFLSEMEYRDEQHFRTHLGSLPTNLRKLRLYSVLFKPIQRNLQNIFEKIRIMRV